jgi:hypothetical protein
MASPSIVRGYPVPGPAGLGRPIVYTVATLPAPSALPLNTIVWVSDLNGGTLQTNLTTSAWSKLAAGANEKGGGSEIYFNELGANQTVASGASTDLTLWTATVDVGSRPIAVDASLSIGQTNASINGSFELREGATKLESRTVVVRNTTPVETLRFFKRLAPSAGTHTYTLVLLKPSAGPHTVYAPLPTFGLTGSSMSILER